MRLLFVTSLIFTILCQSAVIAQQPFFEPERGSVLRADLMDAVRPIAEWNLGAPVEFVVIELRASGNVAFAILSPQRPGGRQINLSATPLVRLFEGNPDEMDGANMQVLLRQSGRMWVPVVYGIGELDAWWDQAIFCSDFHRVIPEVCATD